MTRLIAQSTLSVVTKVLLRRISYSLTKKTDDSVQSASAFMQDLNTHIYVE